MKLIIGAMQEELKDSIDFYNLEKETDTSFEIYKNKDLLISITGVGLVNAAAQLAYILTKYEISEIINIGTSGAYDQELKQGDVVLIDKIFNSAADATAFGYAYGQVPRMPEFFSSFKNEKILQIQGIKTKNIASSDVFINSLDLYNKFVKKINHQISIMDMECYAYAQVAYIFKKQISVIKIISDTVGNKQNNLQFNEFIPIAGKQILEIIKKVL